MALLPIARHCARCLLHVTTPREGKRTVLPQKVPGKGDQSGWRVTVTAGRLLPKADGPEWIVFAIYKLYHFNVWDDSLWEWKVQLQAAGLAVPKGPRYSIWMGTREARCSPQTLILMARSVKPASHRRA